MVKKIKTKFNKIHDKHVKPLHQHDRVHEVLNQSVIIMGTIGSLMSLPQVIKVYMAESVSGLYEPTWIAFFLASTLWLIYGLFYKLKPILITSSIGFICNLFMVISFFMFKTP